MRVYCFALLTILLVGPSAYSEEVDHRLITCRAFLQSGQANMAATFMCYSDTTRARLESSRFNQLPPIHMAGGSGHIARSTRTET